jgi:hypothetical protein
VSVYVDTLVGGWAGAYKGKDAGQAARVGARTGHRWCHLIADAEDELHRFAASIGLKRAWCQGDHYDLTPGRRARAVKAGAVEVDRRWFVRVMREHRRRCMPRAQP